MNDAAAPAENITIGLDADEALVLFELLSRWSDDAGRGDTPSAACFESPAECAVLNTLCCLLERRLAAPFSADYSAMLAAARERFQPGWRYSTLRS